MTIARNNTDRDDSVDFSAFISSTVPERCENYRGDDRRDAWEGDDEWADVFGYSDEPDWDDYAEYLDSLDDDDDDDYPELEG